MNGSLKLHSVLISRVASADEKSIAKELLAIAGINGLISDMERSTIIVVPEKGVPSFIIEDIDSLFKVPCVVCPHLSSVSKSHNTKIQAETFAFTLCNVIKTVLNTPNPNLKGIVTLAAGITFQDQDTPGSLVWDMMANGCLKVTTDKINVTIASTFHDTFSRSAVTNAEKMSAVVNVENKPLPELCDTAMAAYSNSGRQKKAEMAKSLVTGFPGVYLAPK